MAREPFQRYLLSAQITEDLSRALVVIAEDGATDVSSAPTFFLAQGHIKNFATREFYLALTADGVILEARSMAEARLTQLGRQASDADSKVIIDPNNYFDRSPLTARPPSYDRLPYAAEGRVTGFGTDDERRAYVEPILDYQARQQPDAFIAPYFYAARGEPEWIQESLDMARISEEVLRDRDDKRELWTTVAVGQDFFRRANRASLLNLVTSRLPSALYVFVSSSQRSFAPLGDGEVLTGMRELIDTLGQARVPIIFGRRYSSGLLLLALGANGFSSGYSAKLQNFQPHPEEEEDGGRGADWYYVPQLLNSIRIETRRDLVADGKAPLIACACQYCVGLFAPGASGVINSTAERILLHQHNLRTLREQARTLATYAQRERLEQMRRWIDDASATYESLAAPWAPGETSGFLTAWAQLL